MNIRHVLFCALLAIGVLCITTPSSAYVLVPSPVFDVETHASADVDLATCKNSPGPEIAINGQWAVSGGLKLIVTLRQNKVHGTTVEEVLDPVIINLGDEIRFPKSPVKCNDEGTCGVGGNPHILAQLLDGHGDPLTYLIYIGRCNKGGLGTLASDVLAAALAVLRVDANCSNSPGPFITFGGTIVVSEGVSIRLVFRNNLKGTHESDVVRDVVLIAEGRGFTIPKQPSRGGVGGNPEVIIQFSTLDDILIGEPINLGKCKQI